jgi:hypothetical protein
MPSKSDRRTPIIRRHLLPLVIALETHLVIPMAMLLASHWASAPFSSDSAGVRQTETERTAW